MDAVWTPRMAKCISKEAVKIRYNYRTKVPLLSRVNRLIFGY
jgi:hypothetical protein